MTHENAGQSGAQDLKLYSVAFSTWNGSFSGLDHHNVLAVGSGAEDAIRRTKETVSQDARDFKAVEIDHVMGCKIVTLDEAASMAMQTAAVRLTPASLMSSSPPLTWQTCFRWTPPLWRISTDSRCVLRRWSRKMVN